MNKRITQKDIFHILGQIQHPEIAASLIDLRMILDVAIDGKLVNVAVALPVDNIPQAVQNALIQSIEEPMAELHLKSKIHFFTMTEEDRKKFFLIAKDNWKGSI